MRSFPVSWQCQLVDWTDSRKSFLPLEIRLWNIIEKLVHFSAPGFIIDLAIRFWESPRKSPDSTMTEPWWCCIHLNEMLHNNFLNIGWINYTLIQEEGTCGGSISSWLGRAWLSIVCLPVITSNIVITRCEALMIWQMKLSIRSQWSNWARLNRF